MNANELRRVIEWFISGDTGISSEAIAAHMCGIKPRDAYFAPSDPADLGRCLRLLELFPQWKPRIHEMAKYGKGWAARVAQWDEISAMMADEVGIDWSKGKSAPRTYAAMKAKEQP